MEDYRLIDYDHSPDERTCNAVVTEECGSAEAVWSLDHEGGIATEAYPVSLKAFAALWNGIAASLVTGGVFRAHLVTDPTRPIDPHGHHVVATAEFSQGLLRYRTFMVPTGEADPVFTGWLATLVATWRRPLATPGRTIRKSRVVGDKHRVRSADQVGQHAGGPVQPSSPDARLVVATPR